MTPDDARRLLTTLGAPPRLVHHAEQVHDAACALLDALEAHGAAPQRDTTRVGALLHDVGKCLHLTELDAPGRAHEQAGQRLLLDHGVAPALARFCITHAEPDAAPGGPTLEELAVALADKLWKGKRVHELERRLIERVAQDTGRDLWALYAPLDDAFEAIAADADRRLRASKDT